LKYSLKILRSPALNFSLSEKYFNSLFTKKNKFYISFLSFLLFFVLNSNIASAQEPQTIKVKKEQNLVKAFFDNVEFKLRAIDRFGNPKENKIVSYKLWIKEKNAKGLSGFDNKLSADMIEALSKQKKAAKIFFTEISVEDDNGHVIKLPDIIDTWFPNCKNCDVRKR